MSTLKYIFLCLFALVALTGCGPKETDSTNAKEDQDRASLRATLSQFQGNYQGTVTPTSGNRRPVRVELQLIVQDIPDGGTNDSREVTFHPELRGFFFLPGFASQPISRRPIRIRYYRERQEISMDNTDTLNSPTPNNGVVKMSGTMVEGTIDGPITYTVGDTVIGNLHAERVR